MAPATGLSAGMGSAGTSAVGSGLGTAMGLQGIAGKGAASNPKAAGMLDTLAGKSQAPPMFSPPQIPAGELSRPAPVPTDRQKMSMLIDRMGGPQGIMKQMRGTTSKHKPAPQLPIGLPQLPTINPFERSTRPMRPNLGMGRLGGRY
jgi:hypothetical protein